MNQLPKDIAMIVHKLEFESKFESVRLQLIDVTSSFCFYIDRCQYRKNQGYTDKKEQVLYYVMLHQYPLALRKVKEQILYGVMPHQRPLKVRKVNK